MTHPGKAYVCAECGCLVIVLPVALEMLGPALKGHGKAMLLDQKLGDLTGCIVSGRKANLNEARSKLGVEVIP